MIKAEWVTQCAARIHKNGGLRKQDARQSAESLANDESDLNGASGIAWREPEDVADEYVDDLNG